MHCLSAEGEWRERTMNSVVIRKVERENHALSVGRGRVERENHEFCRQKESRERENHALSVGRERTMNYVIRERIGRENHELSVGISIHVASVKVAMSHPHCICFHGNIH